MRVSQIVLVVLLAVLAVVVHSQDVNPLELQHLLIKRETECMDVCLASVSSNQNKCRDACSRLVEEESVEIAQTLADNSLPLDIEALADQSPDERQNEATANLWELYYDKFSQMFASKGYSAGLQILPNAIELTDIRSDIPGAEWMDNFAVTQARAQDYDDPAVLARELIQVTKPGKFREPVGVRIVDEFKQYLTGFEGVGQIEIPDGISAESARRTQEYEDAIMACTENYFASASSWFFLRMYELDAFMKQFCPRVGQTEQAMYAQIGVEAARVNNNPAFAAAVALGRAQLYTDYSAFVKRHTIRTMELECVKAQNEGRPAKGTARSFSFYHDYSSYKYKGESKTKSMSIGLGFISVGKASANMKMTGFDAASISGVDIAFEDYKYIPLHPGQWFSSMALRDLRFTRRNPHSPIGRFLGDSGSLSLIPRGLFVAVNPTVAFQMDSSQKESLKSASQKSFSIGLNIFGFSFGLGMGKGSSIDEGEGNGGKSRIAFVSRTCRPQLFAVDHYYFY